MKYFFLFFIFTTSLLAQSNYYDYHKLIIKAKECHNDSVIFYLENAFKKANPFPDDLKWLSFEYFKINKKKKSYINLKKSFRRGLQLEKDREIFSDFIINYDLLFYNEKDSSIYGKFLYEIYYKNVSVFRKIRKKYVTDNNFKEDNLSFEMLLLNEKYFQDLRFLFFDNKVIDSVSYKSIAKYGSTPNSYIILNILKKNKFPKRRKCNRFNSQSITILFNHAVSGFIKKEDAELFLNLLWDLVEKGEIFPEEYAETYDNFVINFIDRKKQKFGTFVRFEEKDTSYHLLDLLDPIDISFLREKYLLQSIESYCLINNWKLPNNYGK